MEMQQVRYFLALAKELNFTRAADVCNVTQPALTRSIQSLEAELGGQLFRRERKQSHLSELGKMMYPHIESIQRRSDAAKAHAQSYAQLDDIELRLGTMCTIGPRILSPLLVDFHKQFSAVTLAIHDEADTQLVENVLKGDLEIGILGHSGEVDERLHAIPMFVERFVVVLPPNHSLAKKKALQVKDLDGEPYLNRINCEVFTEAAAEFARQGVDTPMVFRSERDDWVLDMIRTGLGWGFFPEFCTIPNDLPVRPLIGPKFDRTISLITVRGRPHSPAVGAFVRAIRAHDWPNMESSVRCV